MNESGITLMDITKRELINKKSISPIKQFIHSPIKHIQQQLEPDFYLETMPKRNDDIFEDKYRWQNKISRHSSKIDKKQIMKTLKTGVTFKTNDLFILDNFCDYINELKTKKLHTLEKYIISINNYNSQSINPRDHIIHPLFSKIGLDLSHKSVIYDKSKHYIFDEISEEQLKVNAITLLKLTKTQRSYLLIDVYNKDIEENELYLIFNFKQEVTNIFLIITFYAIKLSCNNINYISDIMTGTIKIVLNLDKIRQYDITNPQMAKLYFKSIRFEINNNTLFVDQIIIYKTPLDFPIDLLPIDYKKYSDGFALGFKKYNTKRLKRINIIKNKKRKTIKKN